MLIDGDYGYDSVFKVAEIGHPPSERRDEALCVPLEWQSSARADLTLFLQQDSRTSRFLRRRGRLGRRGGPFPWNTGHLES